MSASFLLVFAELNVDNMVQAVLKVPTMKTRKTFVSEDSYKKRPILFGSMANTYCSRQNFPLV